jgi:hypothetical protein
MEKGSKEFNQIYQRTANLSKDLVGKVTYDVLCDKSIPLSNQAREVRFDMVPGTEHMYDMSIVPINRPITLEVELGLPTTKDFELRDFTSSKSCLATLVDAVANPRGNRPEVIRVMRAIDDSAYAIFTR